MNENEIIKGKEAVRSLHSLGTMYDNNCIGVTYKDGEIGRLHVTEIKVFILVCMYSVFVV